MLISCSCKLLPAVTLIAQYEVSFNRGGDLFSLAFTACWPHITAIVIIRGRNGTCSHIDLRRAVELLWIIQQE